MCQGGGDDGDDDHRNTVARTVAVQALPAGIVARLPVPAFAYRICSPPPPEEGKGVAHRKVKNKRVADSGSIGVHVSNVFIAHRARRIVIDIRCRLSRYDEIACTFFRHDFNMTVFCSRRTRCIIACAGRGGGVIIKSIYRVGRYYERRRERSDYFGVHDDVGWY